MSPIVVNATLKLNDLLFCKYRLICDKNQWGLTWDVSTLGWLCKILLLPMRIAVSMVVVTIIYPVMFIYGVIIIYRNTRKELGEEKYLTISYVFDDAGITFFSTTKNTIGWHEIETIKEVKGYFYVFFSSKLLLIPKRDFKTADDLSRVKKLFGEKLSRKALRLKAVFI